MIESFYSVQQALDYFPRCLVCGYNISGLDFIQSAAAISTEVDYTFKGRESRPKLIYKLLENGYEEVYEIDVHTSRVDRRVTIRNEECVAGSFAGTTRYGYTGSSTPPTSGLKYLYLGVSCQSCKKYDYALQLIVDLDPLAMKRILLNSERVIFQENELGERREIRNVYTTRRTEYSYFRKPEPGTIVEELKQELPLLPFNRVDPNKTLERVKNLLIFT